MLKGYNNVLEADRNENICAGGNVLLDKKLLGKYIVSDFTKYKVYRYIQIIGKFRQFGILSNLCIL
jgi:hypothetical protein